MFFLKNHKQPKKKLYLAVDNSKNFNHKKTYPIKINTDYYDRNIVIDDFMKTFFSENGIDL